MELDHSQTHALGELALGPDKLTVDIAVIADLVRLGLAVVHGRQGARLTGAGLDAAMRLGLVPDDRRSHG